MSASDNDGNDDFLTDLDGAVTEAYGVPPAAASEAERYSALAPRDILIEMSWRAMKLPQNWLGYEARAIIVQLPSEPGSTPLQIS